MMWARVCELLLAVWLAATPLVFRESADAVVWVSSLVGSAAVALFAWLSFVPRLSRAHLLSLVVAVWLIVAAWMHVDAPPPAAYQSLVIVALLLLMFAIIPSHASRPPRGWSAFYESRRPTRDA